MNNTYDQGAWAEIEELERCYGSALRDMRIEMNSSADKDQYMTTNNSDLNELAGLVIEGLAQNVARTGTKGPWCWYCGTSATESPAVHCRCGYGRDFMCADRRICGDCARAHEHVAEHLERMFAARRVSRVSSVRARLFRNLYTAALPNDDDFDAANPHGEHELLHFHLAQADEFEDEQGRFRENVLRAFKKAQFLDFQGLDRELVRVKENELSRAALIWLRAESRRPKHAPDSVGANAKGLDFYK